MQTSTYNIALKFDPERLVDIFGQRFLSDFGMVKMKEIHEKTQSSPKINNYLQQVGPNSYRPTHTGIISTLNTITYFIFSKGETLCMGALFVLMDWNSRFNEDNLVLTDNEVTMVAADIIKYSSEIKFGKKDNLFSRFFNDIEEINRTPESKYEDYTPPSTWLYDDEDFDYGDRY